MGIRQGVLLAVGLILWAAVSAAAEPRQTIDASPWEALPVFEGGRVMPLDSLARQIVRRITGRTSPKLAPPAAADEPAGWTDLFPDGQPRRFAASELLLGWLLEPELWEDVDFLPARNESLREDLLGAPLRGPGGERLQYVSPRQVDRATRYSARLDRLAEEERAAALAGRRLDLTGTDEAVAALARAYQAYRAVTFDPDRPEADRQVFSHRLDEVLATWREQLAPRLGAWRSQGGQDELVAAVEQVDAAAGRLVGLLHAESYTLAEAEGPVAKLREGSAALARYFAAKRNRAFAAMSEDAPMLEAARAMTNALAATTAQFAREVGALQAALYENALPGQPALLPRIMPSLDPLALEADRRGAAPWLSWPMLLRASDEVLAAYPAAERVGVRRAYAELRAVYRDHAKADRPERLSAAIESFNDSLRRLGEAVEPLRRKLPGTDESASLLATTAYPPPGYADRELLYNRLDPFRWSWVLTAAALGLLACGVGRIRSVTFWSGAAVLLAGQVFTILGLGLRAEITGMVPVTNMFETVLFVGLTVALLGLWFALLPVLWPGLGPAWRMTALPAADEDWNWRRIALLVLRAVLAAGVLYVLTMPGLGPKGKPILSFDFDNLARTLASPTATLGLLALVAIGGALVFWALWFMPRAALATPIALVLAPVELARGRSLEPARQAVARRWFLTSGAAVALLAYLVAYFAPGEVFDREVGLGMAAVLRSNFWLALHVLIVTASYGAGALAWGLANRALVSYAFGRYRHEPAGGEGPGAGDEEREEGRGDGDRDSGFGGKPLAASQEPLSAFRSPLSRRRPPEICATLAGYIYRATQVAVLLLAAGTITGAIWADYAWGRYWGWDKKEIGALVTLLVYLVVLHGRWAGWMGPLSLAVGAVVGATAILGTWYGVNFVFTGGLHSYGQGAGGEMAVGACLVANWLLAILAIVRHAVESRAGRR